MKQNYKNKKSSTAINEHKIGYFQKEGNGSMIYVGNMSYKKDEKQVKAMFSKFGLVKYVKLVTDPSTDKSKGIAFVQMPNKLEASKAIKSLNGTIVDDRTLKVSEAIERESDKRVRVQKMKAAENPSQIESEELEVPKKKKRKRDQGLKILFNHLGK